MKGPTAARRRRGFSMVEVVISSTLLIIGISALVVGAHIAIQQHEHNRKVARALIVAEERMEALLMLFPTSDELEEGRHPGSDFERFDANGRPAKSPDPGLYRVHYTVTLSPPIDGAEDGSRLPGLILETTIAWDESLGERDITLRTVR